MEPIIAWRVWKVDLKTNLLTSVYMRDVIWQPGNVIQSDKLPNFEGATPVNNQSFGIHTWKTLQGALQYVSEWTMPCIVGTVSIWGHIVEHKDGYRAEFAYPDKLQILIMKIDEYYPWVYSIYNKSFYNRKELEINLRNNYGCEVSDFEFNGTKIYDGAWYINFQNGIPSYKLNIKNSIRHYYNGLLHNEKGPAIIHQDGGKSWVKHGQLHREDGPAIDHLNEKFWYIHGCGHRTDGPAVILADGTKEWRINGKSLRISSNKFTNFIYNIFFILKHKFERFYYKMDNAFNKLFGL